MGDVTPMQLGTETELGLLANAVAVGVVMGVVYDLFRVIRHTLSFRAVTVVCDLAYALSFGAVFFVFSLSMTGYYRGFLLAGMTAGAAMWCYTAGRGLSRLAELIIGTIWKYLISPVIGILHKPAELICECVGKIRLKLQKVKKIEKNS